MASLHQNTLPGATENALPPYLRVLPLALAWTVAKLCPHLVICSACAGLCRHQTGRQLHSGGAHTYQTPSWTVLIATSMLETFLCKCIRSATISNFPVPAVFKQCYCMQTKAGKPGKGRLALLKEDNAKFCAPRTRIPTPAPKKKTKAVTVPASTFISRIPSPKSSSGSLLGAHTPEPAKDGAQESDECSNDDDAAFSEVRFSLSETTGVNLDWRKRR